MINLDHLSRELKKCYPHLQAWKHKQYDDWDRKTRFIYDCRKFSDLAARVEQLCKIQSQAEELKNYALHRWYNFWSAKGIEQIFGAAPNVRTNQDLYHKTIDFWIDNIPFDHKTTVFPKRYPFSIADTKDNPIKLIRWLYQHQSKEQRFHLQNRLFLVLIDKNGEHQRLRSEMRLIQKNVEQYLCAFSETHLFKLTLREKQVYSDCIFVES